MPRDTEYPTTCPHCGHICTDASALTSKDDGVKHPRDGDLSMCANCGQYSVFVARAKGGLRKPSKFETNEFITDLTVIRMVGLWAMHRVIAREDPTESVHDRRGQALNTLIYAADVISNHFQVCPACLIMVAAGSIEDNDDLHFKNRHAESETMQ